MDVAQGMIKRITILSACLMLSAAYVASASKTERVPPRAPLTDLPLQLGQWKGQNEPEFSADVLAVLGVDEYLNRVYEAGHGYAGLYIGYYESQRQGDTMHSPLNCLPGAGWEPVSKSYLSIPVGAGKDAQRTINVNRYVIRKGLDGEVVLYWYQSHGRAVANEYRSKVLMVYDAVRLNRTDAAMIRVLSPIGTGPGAEAAAADRAVDFVKTLFPLLDKYLPS